MKTEFIYSQQRIWKDKDETKFWRLLLFDSVTPRFPKYAETESRRESATYIREENTLHIYAKPKVTWTSYKSEL